MHDGWLAVDRPLQVHRFIQQASVKLLRPFQVVVNNEAVCLMAKRQPFACEPMTANSVGQAVCLADCQVSGPNGIPPLVLTGYDTTPRRDPTGRLNPGVILGSASDFDDLALFWNLRAAGATLCFYDQANTARLKPFADGFLDKLSWPGAGRPGAREFLDAPADPTRR